MEMKQFQAESKRLLDMMINSIYTHKEIFLRELISNASDAIDKLYYRALKDGDTGLNRDDFSITIEADKDKRTLTITDNGVGMTKDELDNNLGVIAKSGSLNFKKENERQEDIDIIGQFGVGFYSAFMVSDDVTVVSRAYGSDEAWCWHSTGAEGYTIEPCEKDSNGTVITLHIKDNSEEDNYDEYLDQYVAFVGSNNYAGGVTAGEYIAEHAPEGSTVGCITYASAQSTRDRQAGFEETIQAAIDGGKDLTLIESQDADNDQSKASDIMQNLITQYGEDLSYIFVVGDPTGYGALASIQSAGATTKIVGFDAGQTACEYIADPEVGQIWEAEVAQNPVGIGSGIVDKIAEYFETGAVAGEQKDLIECELVTAENVADYLPAE